MNKLLELQEKSQTILKDILKNEDKYMNFLKVYSSVYKYSFLNALLIYSQNIDTNAFATYKEWQKIGYQVKKGAKGIALFGNKNQVKYVFGVDSTYQKKDKLMEIQ